MVVALWRWRYGGGVVEVVLWFGGILTGFQCTHSVQNLLIITPL